MTAALVTGSTERVEGVAAALGHAGAEVVSVTDLDRLDEAVKAFEPGSLDCYIQLPIALHPMGDSVVSRVRSFLEGGLLARFRLAEAVLPALSAEGRVVLVGGHTPVERAAPDDQAARTAFLNVLAHAIRADMAPATVWVRVLDRALDADEIARVALMGEAPRRRSAELSELVAGSAGMSYQDWRTEVMGLVSVEF